MVDVLRRADLFDAASLHNGDLVTEDKRSFLIMSDEDGGDTEVDEQAVHLCADADSKRRVEVGERLVEEEYRWTRRDRSGEGHALLLPSRPKGLGRVRMCQIDSKNRREEIFEFIDDVIAPGTILYTDGATAYHRIKDEFDLVHEPINLVASSEKEHNMLPAVHRVASMLKRWIGGTLHHGQSSKHLDYYLDEYTFRFNRRTSRSRGMLFYRLLQQAVNTDPHPLKTLTQSDDWT